MHMKVWKELLLPPHHTCLYIDCEVPTGSMRTTKPQRNVGVEPKKKKAWEKKEMEIRALTHSE